MKLFDLAKIIRSKNAGPLYITFDLMFDSRDNMNEVVRKLRKEQISEAYNVPVGQIDIIPYDCVDSIKITFPRKHVSGSLEDDDVYGCQQHMPLAQIELI